MSSRVVSLVLDHAGLESLFEGLEVQGAVLERFQGRCVPGVGLGRLLSRRAELLKLQGALVEAFASGRKVPDEAVSAPRAPDPAPLQVVSGPEAGRESSAAGPVDPARVLSALELGIPSSVWADVVALVASGEQMLSRVDERGVIDPAAVDAWLVRVGEIRRKWTLGPSVRSPESATAAAVLRHCGGCGVKFEVSADDAGTWSCPQCLAASAVVREGVEG